MSCSDRLCNTRATFLFQAGGVAGLAHLSTSTRKLTAAEISTRKNASEAERQPISTRPVGCFMALRPNRIIPVFRCTRRLVSLNFALPFVPLRSAGECQIPSQPEAHTYVVQDGAQLHLVACHNSQVLASGVVCHTLLHTAQLGLDLQSRCLHVRYAFSSYVNEDSPVLPIRQS